MARWAELGRTGGSPLPGTGTAWPCPHRDTGLLPMDGGGGRGWIRSGAGVKAPRAAEGEKREEPEGRGEGSGSPTGERVPGSSVDLR